MEESASHHVFIIAFAQLRAEDIRNDAHRPQKTPKTMEKDFFRIKKNILVRSECFNVLSHPLDF